MIILKKMKLEAKNAIDFMNSPKTVCVMKNTMNVMTSFLLKLRQAAPQKTRDNFASAMPIAMFSLVVRKMGNSRTAVENLRAAG